MSILTPLLVDLLDLGRSLVAEILTANFHARIECYVNSKKYYLGFDPEKSIDPSIMLDSFVSAVDPYSYTLPIFHLFVIRCSSQIQKKEDPLQEYA